MVLLPALLQHAVLMCGQKSKQLPQTFMSGSCLEIIVAGLLLLHHFPITLFCSAFGLCPGAAGGHVHMTA